MQNTYNISGELTFDTVTDNFKRLKKMLRGSDNGKLSPFAANGHDNAAVQDDEKRFLQLNLQGVSHFDSAGLALLIEAKNFAAKYNKGSLRSLHHNRA
jgi:ABC-type transporter Mla MlaB component